MPLWAPSAPLATLHGRPIFYLDDPRYGGDPTGATESTDAIERAIVAAAAVGGEVRAGIGTYMIDWRQYTNFPGYWRCIEMRPGVALRGAGMGATKFKLAPGAASHTSANILSNSNLNGGDADMLLADFEIDGDAANQTTLYYGVQLLRARNVRHERVRALNIRGTAAFPPGETGGLSYTLCTDIAYIGCEVLGTAGETAGGIGGNLGTNIHTVDCLVRGMTHSMGFGSWSCRGVLMANNVAQLCGANGFNIEASEDVTLINNRAGGRAADSTVGGGGAYFTPDQVLGNTGDGITINAGSTKVVLEGNLSSYNGNNGIDVLNASEARIGPTNLVDNNGAYGVMIVDDPSMVLSYVAPGIQPKNNALGALNCGTSGIVNGANLAAPAMPASGVNVTNTYPFPVVVYITNTSGGNITYVYIDNIPAISDPVVGLADGAFVVPPQSQIKLAWWTTAPTWTWWRA